MDQLLHAVVHSLEKDAHTNVASIRMAPGPLDVTLPEVISLATKLAKLVGAQGSTVMYGQFRTGNREGMFPGAVIPLSSDDSVEAFMAASAVAMNEFDAKAREESLATGGYVCFVHYETGGVRYYLVAMVKERGALRLNAQMVPEEIQEIDLSKLHQAARVNLQRYKENLDPETDETATDVETSYLCFIQTRSGNEVAKYFIEALGCERGVSSDRLTKTAIEATIQYIKSIPALKPEANRYRRRILEQLRTYSDGAEISVDSFTHMVKSMVPADHLEAMEGLTPHLNGDKHQVPDRFRVSGRYLAKQMRVVVHAEKYNMSFDASDVGPSQNSAIVFDLTRETLTFTLLPEETKKQLRDIISSK